MVEGVILALQYPWFYCALCVYAIATIFWLYLLQRIPLTLAYPFTALAMVIVPILGIYLFGEKVTNNYWIGAILISSGIVIIAK